jgi:DNA-binding MarR family transcriptional regulator
VANGPAKAIAVNIEHVESAPTTVQISVPTPPANGETLALMDYAKLHLRTLRARASALPELKHGNAQWLILVELWMATHLGTAVSITSASFAAGVPGTTGLRYLRLLADTGYITTKDDPMDGRRCFVSLTADGLARIEAQLEQERACWAAALGRR